MRLQHMPSIPKLFVTGFCLVVFSPVFMFVFGGTIGMILMVLIALAAIMDQEMKIKNVLIFGGYFVAIKLFLSLLGEKIALFIILATVFVYIGKMMLDWFEEEEKNKKRRDFR